MSEREIQRRVVDLSVAALSALVFGGGYLLAAHVDRERAERAPRPQEEPVAHAAASVSAAPAPPLPGLVPAQAPRRRVVVVRRTRAS